MKARNLALATSAAAIFANTGIANAQFTPRTPTPGIPEPGRVDTINPRSFKKHTLTVNNPLGFTIQQKKDGRWTTIGSAKKITRSANLPLGATARFEFRIVDRSNPRKEIFNHSAGGFSSEMWRSTTYTASLGHQGFERTFQVCIPGDRCRSGGNLRSITNDSAEITIRPNPATTKVKLGQGMAFKGNTSTPAMESVLCSPPLGITYVPYFGGRIGGENANGTSGNYLASGTSSRALTQWCGKTFAGSSGFISKNLKLSDMIALTAGGAASFFRNSSLPNMPGAPGAPSAAYWNKGSTYKTFIWDSNTKQPRLIGTFDANVRKSLEETFSNNNKTLYVVRNIYPSNRDQYLKIVNLSNLISNLNNITGSVRANTSGSEWTVTVAGETETINMGEETQEIKEDYKGLKLENRPSMSVSNATLTSSGSNKFEVKFKVNVSKLEGEINNNWGVDYDYIISSGTLDITIPFAIEKEGSALKVKQLKNCARGQCTTNKSGFNFDLDDTPDIVLDLFTDVNKDKITRQIRNKISKNIGKGLQRNLAPLRQREFPIPTIGAIPNISNPLEYFLGIHPDIVPNIRVNASQKTISLKYKPQIPVITPEFMRSQVPLITP